MRKKMNSFIFNFFIPFVIALIIAFRYYQSNLLLDNLQNIIGDMVGIIATLFGFVITALSILLTIQGNEKTKQIMNSRHYKTILLTYLVASIYMLIGLFIFIIIYSFNYVNKLASFFYLFFIFISIFYLILTLFYLGLVLLTLFHKKPNYH